MELNTACPEKMMVSHPSPNSGGLERGNNEYKMLPVGIVAFHDSDKSWRKQVRK